MTDSDLLELAARWGWTRSCLDEVRGRLLPATVPLPREPARERPPAPPASNLETWRGEADTGPSLPRPAPRLPERYEDLGRIGQGGMGEVRRVRDRVLDRVLAMKLIHASLASDTLLSRFTEEAKLTARLQHPGIVPVHDLGRLPDGRMWFTMREVRGRTFAEVIAEVHAASPPDRWEAAATGWSFRRLVDALHKVCEAVAYAHRHGVLHRDLKPGNVMVGEFGEVLVLDWGLAKAAEGPDPLPADTWSPTPSRRSSATRPGSLVGTPAYMSPEQARGEVHRIDARTDVFLLGSMLYELLAGEPPGKPLTPVDADAPPGPPAPPSLLPAGTRPVPEELLAVLRHARAPDPTLRYTDAAEMALEVAAWLDGASKRERALAVVADAGRRERDAAELRSLSEAVAAQAEELHARIPAWAPAAEKERAWAVEDAARDIARSAELAELDVDHLLHAALTHVPDLPEAHAALGERHRARHAAAELVRDRNAAAREEAGIRRHAEALPDQAEARARLLRWLGGEGRLSLAADAPDATARLSRYVERARRLVPVPVGEARPLPLDALVLEHGSWLVELSAPGRAPVRYPVHLGRGEHWDGPPVHLPAESALGPDDVYVPAGPTVLGGDPLAPQGLPRRRASVPGFVIRRFPVTNAEYLTFLDALVRQGREDEAVGWAPRERGAGGEPGTLIYGRRPDGGFELRADSDGDRWAPDWPVMMLPWEAAEAYTRWFAEATGLPWRLPWEAEWEKAARGVDARLYPWGDRYDPSWACTRDSHRGRPLPAAVGAWPDDLSPYGVRDLGGGVRDWCADPWRADGPPLDLAGRFHPPAPDAPRPPNATEPGLFRLRRGGAWTGGGSDARACYRQRAPANTRDFQTGFRLVRSL